MAAESYRVNRQAPLAHEADVIVVGSGPGGVGAAVMAARAGAKTLLIERYGFPGGMATAGEISPFMRNHVKGESLDGPVYGEWIDRMLHYWPHDGNPHYISKNVAVLAMEDLCTEAGVELLYHHTLADVAVTDGRIDGIILHSKSGFTAAKAPMYVDCTGDADLAALAGCECEQGGPTGHCQPMTLCFKLCNVDTSRMPERARISELYNQAQQRGEIDCARENVLMFDWLRDDVVHLNTTRIIHRDATNGPELSDAEIQGRRQVRQYLAFFRAHVPGFEQAQLHSMAHEMGVRESRRVRGHAYLERDAFEKATKCPDAIARVRYTIDIHNPDGGGTEIVRMPEGEWYEIPYGCVVARDVSNLLIGGRPISVDHAIHSSMRIMPPACTVGQAAGMGAAMAVKQGCTPAELDGVAVRQALIAQGAPLE